MAVMRFQISNGVDYQFTEVLLRLALQVISFAHKRHTLVNGKDCTHLVLAVAITSCWTTCHFVKPLGNSALLANSLYGKRKGGSFCC